jgi:hypothetical protein
LRFWFWGWIDYTIFTFVLVIQLVEENKTDLDKPIRRYLSNYFGATANTIKVRLLLNYFRSAQYRCRLQQRCLRTSERNQLPATVAQLIALLQR